MDRRSGGAVKQEHCPGAIQQRGMSSSAGNRRHPITERRGGDAQTRRGGSSWVTNLVSPRSPLASAPKARPVAAITSMRGNAGQGRKYSTWATADYGAGNQPRVSNRQRYVYIQNGTNQIRTPGQIKKTEGVVSALRQARSSLGNQFDVSPIYFFDPINAAHRQKSHGTGFQAPWQLREERLAKLDKASCFVFVYDSTLISPSSGVELGYWLARGEARRRAGLRHSTVMVMMNQMDMPIASKLPDCTYLRLADDTSISASERMEFPGLVKVDSINALASAFENVMIDQDLPIIGPTDVETAAL